MSQKKTTALEIAHFRFALIAPVVQGVFPDATATAYYRRVTASPITRPDGSTYSYDPGTLAKWYSLYSAGGMDALMPTGRSDKGLSRALTDTAIEEIYRLKEKFPKLNATQIHSMLIQEAYIPATVSVAAVQRFIKNNDLKLARTTNVRDRKAFEESSFGKLWQADTCYLPYITEDGKSRRTYLIMILDDHSRMIVGAEIFYNDKAYNVQKVFKRAIKTYGIPLKLYTDNGSSYRNDQLRFICGDIGCIGLHTPVRDGASKGKVERAFRTLRERWLNKLDVKQVKSLEEMNQLLNSYVTEYNRTEHSSIKTTPMERFIASRHDIKLPLSNEWLDDCFYNRVSRKVNNDATIKLDGVSYDAPIQFIGMMVDIRYLPDAMEDAYILYEKGKYPIRVTNKVANCQTKRNNTLTIDYSKVEVAHA